MNEPNAAAGQRAATGIAGLDQVLGGGFPIKRMYLIEGEPGTGKTTLSLQFLLAGARCGEAGVYVTLSETRLGLQLGDASADGRIDLRRTDPAECSPGGFAEMVMRAVGRDGVRVVVIDSVNGYLNAMPEERFLALHLHELLSFLGQHGVLTLMVLAQHGLLGNVPESPVELSYLADTVILLRYFEAFGRVRQAISALKKRTGNHERSVREIVLSPDGIHIGDELRQFQGVLSGNLVFIGEKSALLAEQDAHAAR
jgi:circadian clock protein KaiC